MQKLILLFVIIGCFSFQGKSQQSKHASVSDSASRPKHETIYTKVEVEAAFPGGDSKWRNFLQRKLNGNIPTANGAPSGTYTTMIQFVVYFNGTLGNFTALTNHGFGMEAEAIRCLSNGPKWIPATIGGTNVSSYRKQPITFVVQ